MEAIIQTDGLTKRLGGQCVVDHVDLTIASGSICGIAGPNGAGKTTLLKLLLGYYWPTSGDVRVFGRVLGQEDASIRQSLYYLDAEGTVIQPFRIQDLVRYSQSVYPRFDPSRFDRLCRALDLPTRGRLNTLSLGMRTQLRLAVGLATRPQVLFLDEPTNGLDPIVKRQFLQFFVGEAVDSGTTVLLATHHLDDLDRVADSAVVLYRGRLIASGRLEDIKAHFVEVQALLPKPLPASLVRRNDVVKYDKRGALHRFVVCGSTEGLLQELRDCGATHLEIVPLSMEEVFRYMMEREGYHRETVSDAQ